MSAMNLGDSNLKYVNSKPSLHHFAHLKVDANRAFVPASRPQLVHSASKQSITASDDYYSLTSDLSSNEDRPSNARYETPPLHARPDPQQREQIASPLGHQSQDERLKLDTISAVSHREDHAITRKPVSASSDGTAVNRPFSEASSPTPGVDDTPYIQFAIDQLTRDEEIAGSRRQSLVKEKGFATYDPSLGKEHEVRMPAPPPIPPSEDPRLSRKFEWSFHQSRS